MWWSNKTTTSDWLNPVEREQKPRKKKILEGKMEYENKIDKMAPQSSRQPMKKLFHQILYFKFSINLLISYRGFEIIKAQSQPAANYFVNLEAKEHDATSNGFGFLLLWPTLSWKILGFIVWIRHTLFEGRVVGYITPTWQKRKAVCSNEAAPPPKVPLPWKISKMLTFASKESEQNPISERLVLAV